MENKVKDHIDKLLRKRMKEAIDGELEKRKNELDEPIDNKAISKLKAEIKKAMDGEFKQQYEYGTWLNQILSIDTKGAHFPTNRDEEDLFQLLTLDVLYKRSLKSACDDGHPIMKTLLEGLQMGEDSVQHCIEKVKSFSQEPLAFYLLFQEELESTGLSMTGVCEKIDQLSEDSAHGTVVSHPAKMTNPECKFPKFYATSSRSNDGFIRTGNSKAMFDMHINAVNLKVYKFISLVYEGKQLLEYIKEGNIAVFRKIFGVSEEKATLWIQGFSACVSNEDTRTNQYVRQVFFPVEDDYHLLSLLTPSGLVFSLKDKIDSINDRSPDAYSGRRLKKENKYCGNGFSSIPNLTKTRHGGDHPKNISGLNNTYQSYYLLHSAPPKLEKREVRFPKRDFFRESFRYYEYREIFDALHKLFKTDYNNIHIREGRDYRLQDLMDRIIAKMWAVRAVSAEQYRSKQSQLKAHQRIWLCDECQQIREDENDWLDRLCKEIAAWTIRTYEKLLGKNAFKLGEAERLHVHSIVTDNREALR